MNTEKHVLNPSQDEEPVDDRNDSALDCDDNGDKYIQYRNHNQPYNK